MKCIEDRRKDCASVYLVYGRETVAYNSASAIRQQDWMQRVSHLRVDILGGVFLVMTTGWKKEKR
jgi:hypothetical protein